MKDNQPTALLGISRPDVDNDIPRDEILCSSLAYLSHFLYVSSKADAAQWKVFHPAQNGRSCRELLELRQRHTENLQTHPKDNQLLFMGSVDQTYKQYPTE